MNANRVAAGRLSVIWLTVCLGCTASACTWQEYGITRGVRFLTGTRTQVHSIVPITSSLRQYRVIETHSLENLLPGRMPSRLERDLNDALAEHIRLLAPSVSIVRRDPAPAFEQAPGPDTVATRTLVLDGFIDDYDPGYVGLRLVELGFNHLVVTIRIQLRDKLTDELVGAASITAQDNRVTATSRDIIGRLAQRVGSMVGAGYAR